jgi:hypothetical protein
VYQEIVRLWEDTSLERRLIVAFTFGDRQDEDITKMIRNPPPELGRILQAAKKRYVVFNNAVSALYFNPLK